ncbi:NADP-dependent malic enzyme [Bacteroidia bacterium]|jgi:malate dehydrogenase (oxaloacetate-decarboxylating)(NADP+)|nr:NADP-dependent malic enzyme [Bacteroidota bacterium]MDA9110695.1 NADP-dependent malic enzyme [Bacteroidia bacterium]
MDSQFDNALDYHSKGRPGKIEVVPTKPTQTKRDLSLAYSPGVAEPCEEIYKNPQDAYKYTAKGNLVAVISNGSAVLGLGNLGPLASKPVMEGKGVLFKIFADIDVFDIEVDASDPQKFIDVVKALEPTFGGINLEDIKAPESFLIEETLKKETNIPLMHDDQHGTAIISTAGLLNALEIAGKKIDEVRVVVSGAGAAGISCVKLWVSVGIKKENIYMFDRDGQVSDDRTDLDEWKAKFKTPKKYDSLADAMVDADVFLGLSVGNIVSQDMVKSMAANPIVFALANPNPEIRYDDALAARQDVIMATGRSDYPNQVNNVLGFPFIFRGALDVRATAINEAMKLAAVKALAALAKEPVPDVVLIAYNKPDMSFGKNYIIPKPLDPRLITRVSPAVAQAAMESGVAQLDITDWDRYKIELRKRMGLDNRFLRGISLRAKQNPQRVVFGEADNPKILKAAHLAREEGSCIPILLGFEDTIRASIDDLGLNLNDCQIIDPSRSPELAEKYGKVYFEKRQRRGLTLLQAKKKMRQRTFFGTMMVELGEADAFISGQSSSYPDTIRPALEIIGKEEGISKVAGMYIIMSKQGPLFFADTTVNINPSSDDLVDIVKMTQKMVSKLQIKPRIAMVSYSNFGSAKGPTVTNIQQAIKRLHTENPEILVDGEMQANTALDAELRQELFPFSKLGDQNANVFIFPALSSGNIAYKMVQSLGITEAIGPVLLGFRKSVHVLQLGSSVREIVNMINLAVVDAQSKKGLF